MMPSRVGHFCWRIMSILYMLRARSGSEQGATGHFITRNLIKFTLHALRLRHMSLESQTLIPPWSDHHCIRKMCSVNVLCIIDKLGKISSIHQYFHTYILYLCMKLILTVQLAHISRQITGCGALMKKWWANVLTSFVICSDPDYSSCNLPSHTWVYKRFAIFRNAIIALDDLQASLEKLSWTLWTRLLTINGDYKPLSQRIYDVMLTSLLHQNDITMLCSSPMHMYKYIMICADNVPLAQNELRWTPAWYLYIYQTNISKKQIHVHFLYRV